VKRALEACDGRAEILAGQPQPGGHGAHGDLEKGGDLCHGDSLDLVKDKCGAPFDRHRLEHVAENPQGSLLIDSLVGAHGWVGPLDQSTSVGIGPAARDEVLAADLQGDAQPRLEEERALFAF
jgi:hypothetical protein